MVKVNTKTLLKKVAKTSGYKPYEVEDIFEHLIANIQLILVDGDEIKLNGLGTISTKKYKPRIVEIKGREPVMVYNMAGLSLRVDESFRRTLKESNEESLREQRQSQGLALSD
jgi:nucleoid DNA-binding protein